MGIFDALFSPDVEQATTSTGPAPWVQPYLQRGLENLEGVYSLPSPSIPGAPPVPGISKPVLRGGQARALGQVHTEALRPDMVTPQAESVWGSLAQGGQIQPLGVDPYLQSAIGGGVLSAPGTGDYLSQTIGGAGLGSSPTADYLAQARSGQFLNSPGLERMIQSQVERALPRLNDPWIAAGRTGSPGQARALSEGIGRVVSDAYGRERGLQQQAAGMELGDYGRERGLQQGAAQAALGQRLSELGLQQGAAQIGAGRLGSQAALRQAGQLGALGLAPSVQGLGMTRPQQMMDMERARLGFLSGNLGLRQGAQGLQTAQQGLQAGQQALQSGQLGLQQQAQMLPWGPMSAYASALGQLGGLGGQQATQDIYGPSPFQTIAGLGLTGAGMLWPRGLQG